MVYWSYWLLNCVEHILAFFSFCCWTTWVFFGAMTLPAQKQFIIHHHKAFIPKHNSVRTDVHNV